jgi:small subunit ribosomal protein S20
VANHPSAEKRNRQRVKRTLRNRGVASTVRTLVKRVRTALHAKDQAAASTALKVAVVALDKAATKGVVHPKAASRTISRLSAQIHKLGAGAAPAAK